MRICINAVSDVGAPFGSGVYLVGLSRALSNVDCISLIILIGSNQSERLPKDLLKFAREVDVPAGRSYRQILYQRRIQEMLRREKVDVYHLPNSLPLLSKVCPTVISIHDLSDLRVRKYGIARTVYRTMVNYRSARLCDHVLTLSSNSKSDIASLLRVPKEKITVTFAGVDARFTLRDREQCKSFVRQKYGIEGDFVLAPGGFSRNKNIDNLLLSIVELKKLGADAQLVVTGHADQQEVKHVQDRARQLKLQDSIRLPGYVNREDLPFFYGGSSVVVYPSSYEGFGLPAVEAMASGVPLVAANTSSLPEVVGNAGLLVDVRSPAMIAGAVNQIQTDSALRSRLIGRGLDRAKLFSWSKVAERVVQVYEQVSKRERGINDYESREEVAEMG